MLRREFYKIIEEPKHEFYKICSRKARKEDAFCKIFFSSCVARGLHLSRWAGLPLCSFVVLSLFAPSFLLNFGHWLFYFSCWQVNYFHSFYLFLGILVVGRLQIDLTLSLFFWAKKLHTFSTVVGRP